MLLVPNYRQLLPVFRQEGKKMEFPEHTLEVLLRLVDVGVHVVDATGVTRYFNDAAAKLEGLKPEQVIGRHILDVYPSLDGQSSTLLQVASTMQPMLNHQQSFSHYKGNNITTVNSTWPIVVDGRLQGVVEVSKDITEVRQLSERLVDLQARIFDKSPKKSERQTTRYTFDDLIGQDKPFIQLKRTALRAADSSSSVLVWGETGTGKELLVQSIHHSSPRGDKPFVAQNCAALPETLLESILFGTIRGSFTGAENRPGLFELADGGSLFLDEINALPPSLQVKLLRVLQERYVRRIGDHRVRPVDVRIISAMNVDPWQAVQQGQLREDLYFRINVVQLKIPPLRERPDDLPLLVQHFLDRYNRQLSKQVMGLSDAVEQLFHTYSWPGNVRELEHAIEGALNISDLDIIELDQLPVHLRYAGERQQPGLATGAATLQPGYSLRDTLAEIEIKLIDQALRQSDNNISHAADLLGIPRQTLQYRLRALHMV